MRTRNTAFSLAVVLVLLVLLVFAVQQNPQSADWTLFGQSFALSAGVAIASAMLIGFLLAALFVAVFIGAPTNVTTATATTETQAERDLIQSREQYRQLQAEHSRLQTAYNQFLAERGRARNAPAAAMPSDPTAQVHPASPLYPMSAPPATPPAISGAANANIVFPATPPAPTSTRPDDDTSDANASPATAHIARPAPTDTQTDIPPSRQVIRPDGTIVGSENDTPPPPDDSTDYHPSH